MINILITGKNSYIGSSLEKWLTAKYDDYRVTIVDVQDSSDWKYLPFSTFDVVFHVAAIVHIKEKLGMAQLFQEVNCDLPIELALKAKRENVKHFIFMSTMSVYGISTGYIDKTTPACPNTLYGKSKLAAEGFIRNLADEHFAVSIIRSPMVYGGVNCRGNFTRLMKLIKIIPVFPDFPNKRSFIYIDNLCEFIRLLITEGLGGLFFPQNDEYLSSSDLVREIAKELKKRVIFTKLFNPMIRFYVKNIHRNSRLFSDLIYDKGLSNHEEMLYCVHSTEGGSETNLNKNLFWEGI